MAIDKADWHWDDAEKLYRKTNNVEGKLTEEQQEEIWLLASNHIGLFLRWLIDRGFNELIDESDEEACAQVREGKMSGAEYLMHILDGAFCENDIKPNVRDFAVNYYDKQYFNDYGKTCPAKDLCVPCYSFISGDDDYNALRPLIDEAYEEYCREKKQNQCKPTAGFHWFCLSFIKSLTIFYTLFFYVRIFSAMS